MSTAAERVIDYVQRDPSICQGKAVVRGTRIKVSELARRYEFMGQSPDDIVAELPHLTLAQVHAALAYYYDHRGEIQVEIQAEDDFVEQLGALDAQRAYRKPDSALNPWPLALIPNVRVR